jgi:hypothetical protein
MITEEELADQLAGRKVSEYSRSHYYLAESYRRQAHALLVFLDSKGVMVLDEDQEGLAELGVARVSRLPRVE